MTTVALYARLSRDKNGESTSVADQVRECMTTIEERGWELLADPFIDNDVSASSGRPRPAWKRMLTRLDEVDVIVCWSSDRLYRQPRDLEVLIERAEQGALKVLAIHSGDIDLNTPPGRAIARTLAAWSRAEVENLADRVSRKAKSMAEAGKYGGGRRPFGYEADGVTIREPEAELFRSACAAIINGASLKSVARAWNASGIARTRSTKDWDITVIRQTLLNPRYAGRRMRLGEDVGKAAWPPIITPGTHRRVVAVLNEPGRFHPHKVDRYLLTGLLVCGVCGGRMVGKPNNGKRAYTCRVTGVAHLRVIAPPLEELVAEASQNVAAPGPETVIDPSTVAAPILAEQESLATRRSNLAVDYAAGTVSRDTFIVATHALDVRDEELAVALDEATPMRPVDAYLARFERFDVSTDPDVNMRAWLDAVVDHVTIAPGTPGSHIFDAGRASIVWRDGVRSEA